MRSTFAHACTNSNFESGPPGGVQSLNPIMFLFIRNSTSLFYDHPQLLSACHGVSTCHPLYRAIELAFALCVCTHNTTPCSYIGWNLPFVCTRGIGQPKHLESVSHIPFPFLALGFSCVGGLSPPFERDFHQI